jgi:uncharacterized protein with GYD domain
MATFVILASFTDQGVRNIKETTKRADAFNVRTQTLRAFSQAKMCEILGKMA